MGTSVSWRFAFSKITGNERECSDPDPNTLSDSSVAMETICYDAHGGMGRRRGRDGRRRGWNGEERDGWEEER